MQKPTLRQKVEVYEHVLHQIQLYSSVVMDSAKISELIDLINNWSYAHRCGNGELSERQQQSIINKAFNRLQQFPLRE